MTLSLVTLSGLTASFTSYPHNQCSPGVKEKFADATSVCQSLLYNDSLNYQRQALTNITSWNSSVINSTMVGTGPTVNSIPSSVKLASLISLFGFVLGFAVGYGPIVWLLLSEIFPTGISLSLDVGDIIFHFIVWVRSWFCCGLWTYCLVAPLRNISNRY